MWSALITGGLSLLSGLGARQSAKKQQKLQAAYEYMNFVNRQADIITNRTWTNWKNDVDSSLGSDLQARANQLRDKWDPANVARDAEAAGFNPATWLYAMGGNYGTMQQAAESMWTTGLGMKSPQIYLDDAYEQSAPTAQVPSMLETVGNAALAGWNAYRSDQRVEQSQNFQREMLQTQLSAIQRNGSSIFKSPTDAAKWTFFGSGQIPYSVTAGAANAIKAPGKNGIEIGGWNPEGAKTEYANPLGGFTLPDGTTIGHGNYSRFPSAQAVQGVTGDEGPLPILYGGINTANYLWSWGTGRDFDQSLWIQGRELARSRALTNGGYNNFRDGGWQGGSTTSPGYRTGSQF